MAFSCAGAAQQPRRSPSRDFQFELVVANFDKPKSAARPRHKADGGQLNDTSIMATADNSERLRLAQEFEDPLAAHPYAASTVPNGRTDGGTLPFPPFISVSTSLAHDLEPKFEQFDDDVVITSFPKGGTTWLEQIVHLLRSNGVQGDQVLSEAVPCVSVGVRYWLGCE